MDYARFRQAVVAPHWCEGSPLAWVTPHRFGIAHFARDGRVGLFNLAWLVVGHRTPPKDDMAYANAPVMWVIKQAPSIMYKGRTLEDHAALHTLQSFKALVRPLRSSRLESFGMTHVHFQGLLQAASSTARLDV